MTETLSAQLAQSALESAPDGIVVSDTSGTVIFANRQMKALFGYAAEEMLGEPIETLLPERHRRTHLAHRSAYARNPRLRGMGAGLELNGLRKDGTEFPVEVSLSPVRDGERALVVATVRDVSDSRRIEAELVAAREDAERVNVAKSRFLASATHDIRQPLQTLALLTATLHRLAPDGAVSDILVQQDHAIASMLRLVNALLDVSKLQAGVIRPQVAEFSVAAMIEDLGYEFASLAEAKSLALEVEPSSDRALSDALLVKQILSKLLANAIQYTHRGEVVLSSYRQGDKVHIEVRDTGIGIAANEIPYIWDEFYQVTGEASAPREGYGLGLSIATRLIELLGLTVEVRSEPGRGSSFVLGLPASAADTAAASRAQA